VKVEQEMSEVMSMKFAILGSFFIWVQNVKYQVKKSEHSADENIQM
jgi:hypothetical protein